MMLSGAARVALMPFRNATVGKSQFIHNNGQGFIRSFKTSGIKENERQFFRRAKERIGIKDRAMQPTSGTPFQIGRRCSILIELI